MSDLRQRKVVAETEIPATSKSPAIDPERTTKTERTSISLLDILRVIAGLALVSCALSYFVTGTSYTWNLDPWFLQPTRLRAWSVCISQTNILTHKKKSSPLTHTRIGRASTLDRRPAPGVRRHRRIEAAVPGTERHDLRRQRGPARVRTRGVI